MTIDETNVAHETIPLRSSDTDRFYNATLPFIFASCQEVAGEHATQRGMDIRTLKKDENCTWIISRTKITFDRTPVWGDTLSITTFPLDGWHLFCPRWIGADDQNGKRVFSAMTHWIVMDLGRNRPVRPAMVSSRLIVPEEAKEVSPDIGRIHKFTDQEKTEEFEVYRPETTWLDTDFNMHINNVVYTRWIIEALPAEILNDMQIKEIDVQWEAQTYEGDIIRVEGGITEKSEGKISVAQRIVRTEENGEETVLFEANSVWAPKD